VSGGTLQYVRAWLANALDELMERQAVLAIVSENVLIEIAQFLGLHVDEVLFAELPQLVPQRGTQCIDFCLQFPPGLGDVMLLLYLFERRIQFTKHQPTYCRGPPQPNDLGGLTSTSLISSEHATHPLSAT
jgi:hypothetical protein